MAYRNTKAVRTVKPKLQLSKMKIDTKGVSSRLLLITLAFFIIGILAGGFGLHFLTQNDCFEMVSVAGSTDIEIGGESNPDTYQELGVKCIAFGKDVSDTVIIKYLYREDISHDPREVTSIDASVEGFYYVVYTSSNLKYRTVKLIRNVIVFNGAGD